VFATPVLQRAVEFGADIIVYSATKHIDGQGRVLGGAILGRADYIAGPVQDLMRHTGPSLSPFNAWILTKGLETMAMRVRAMSRAAHRVASWLEEQPQVRWVKYPHLDSHPQAELARRQMELGGSVLTFELDAVPDEAKARAFRMLNALEIIDISNNLGDAKSLITHPASTTHRRMGPEGRARVGITDGVIRLSVGLEDVEDLLEDLQVALKA
jgi:O-succinylhomoserine sulfhydrylase